MNEYINELVKAGRAAAQDLWMPRHRGVTFIGGGKYAVWSWETNVPHLADLESALKDQTDPDEGFISESLGGGILEGLGLWIVAGDAGLEDDLNELVWEVFLKRMHIEIEVQPVHSNAV